MDNNENKNRFARGPYVFCNIVAIAVYFETFQRCNFYPSFIYKYRSDDTYEKLQRCPRREREQLNGACTVRCLTRSDNIWHKQWRYNNVYINMSREILFLSVPSLNRHDVCLCRHGGMHGSDVLRRFFWGRGEVSKKIVSLFHSTYI